MASQVPYSGAPDVAPQLDPLSQVHVDTPIAAFGGAVAGAVTHLGETAEGAGKELFARGYAMQEVNEQIKADGAAADVTDAMTKRYLEYDKLKGQDRIDAFPQYMNDIDQIRKDGAANLNSPYAKEQYLRDSRRTQSAMIWHGGMLARQGQDEALTTSTNARMGAASDRLATLGVGEGPDFDRSVGVMKQAAGEYVQNKLGLHPGEPDYDEEVAKATSPHVAKILQSIGRTDGGAAKAKALTDKYVKSGLLKPEDAIHITPAFDNAIDTRDARDVGTRVAAGDPQYWKGKTVDDTAAIAGLKGSPGTSGSYNSVGPDLKDGTHPVGKYGVNSALVAKELPGLALKDEAGNAVTNEEQFKNSPRAQDQFAKTVFPKLQKETGSYDKAFTQWTGDDNPNRLNSAFQHVAKNADPAVISDMARDAMSKKAPNSPVAADNAGTIAVTHQNTAQNIETLSQRRARDETINMINGTGTLDGRVPTSIGDALKDPKFADHYNSLPEPDQQQVLKIIQDNNKLGGVRETSVGTNEYMRLRSIAINRDTTSTPKELDEFSNANLLQLPLSPQHRMELMTLQHKVMQGEIANPNMTHAMGLPAVQKILSDAGISKRDTPDEYNKFTNSFHDAVVAYGQGAERSVKQDQEFTDIAKGLVTKQSSIWHPFSGVTVQKYSDFYNSAAPNIKRMGQELFSKTMGRAFDPDKTEDMESMNHMLMQTIFQKYGTQFKPKSTDRVQ